VKIKQRLALRFTIVCALLIGAILIFIYILTRGFVHADFAERLAQQSRLEVLHYATPHVRDVIPSQSFLLVNPVTSIYFSDGTRVHSNGTYPIPDKWITFLNENAVFNGERGEYTTVGRKYDVNGRTYLVFVSDKDLPGQHELDILIKSMMVGSLVSLILSYMTGLYLAGNALRPVKHVVQEVNQITKDNLSYRLKLDKDSGKVDEVDEMVLTFNALLTRIESAFITQKRFVQNASHELKTPLTAIMAEAELALTRDRTTGEYKRTLQVIVTETERLERLTQGLLTLTRLEEGSSPPDVEALDVCALLNNTLSTFRLHHPEREVFKDGEQVALPIRGNKQLLQIAILNILDNAVKYSAGKIIVKNMRVGDQTHISIQDFGMGIPGHELGRVRSPLFRASNTSAIPGAGLGLPLVDRIVKVHSGELVIVSEEGKGTTCIVKLPTVKAKDGIALLREK
jgi:signal transduction histidine kinase